MSTISIYFIYLHDKIDLTVVFVGTAVKDYPFKQHQ